VTAEVRIGVDLGGTKIEVIALDASGAELIRRRVPTPPSYRPCLEAIANLVVGVERDLGARGSVGVATPGSVSRVTGTMKNANSVFLNGMPLARDLATLMEREIVIANDADCLALSEATDGGGAGADPVFAVIVGTGVGGGLVVGGRLVSGPNGITGEWGHNPLPYADLDHTGPLPECYCGKQGCVETFLSGPGLAADHQRVTGVIASAADIAASAESGDPEAAATIDRYASRLARALSVVINVLDPEVIVVGGGVSNIAALYELVPAAWDRFVFSDATSTRFVPSVHGDSSGVRGAAWLGPAA
jgi:fructokinase